MGGEILFVESSVSGGKGIMTMTGNLGDVMKESATIAYQYIKAHPELAKIDSKTFGEKDIHVHVPEGATPKDGPSAGITMVTSMVSALRGESIISGTAMTGEMTLRGRVLPVGGIKEKILAAKRAGVHTIVISEDNRRDDTAVTVTAALDEAFPHLHRRLSGEGQHKNTGRIDVMTCEQIVDVFGKDERLAAPRACQYKAGPFEVTDRFPLLFVAGKK